jgi:hypothetical protein
MSLHDHVAVLAQGRALDGEGVGGAGISSIEVIYFCHGALDKGAGGQWGKTQTLHLTTTWSFSVFYDLFQPEHTKERVG